MPIPENKRSKADAAIYIDELIGAIQQCNADKGGV